VSGKVSDARRANNLAASRYVPIPALT
jgi:hypothetical protein